LLRKNGPAAATLFPNGSERFVRRFKTALQIDEAATVFGEFVVDPLPDIIGQQQPIRWSDISDSSEKANPKPKESPGISYAHGW